jgi:uroporphyrinogen decarboxylase
VFESWAGELTKKQFDEFCLPYLARIATGVKQRVAAAAEAQGVPSQIPMTVFARNAHFALEDLAKTEYNVISLDW